MLLEPTLRVNEILVHRGKGIAYQAAFHAGVNILRGQNASGKSTIMDFLFYGLGGEDIPWKNEALLCDSVTLEIMVNGTPISVRRHVSETARSPLSFFWGPLSSALKAAVNEWETYPYQRSQSKESFSQVLFRALKLPELRGDGVANITMHQLLRLMYADQRTPNDEIFRSEAFETELNRETIGNYLCGIYSSDLYEAQLELRQVEAQLDRAVSDLRNVFSVLGRSGQGATSTMDFLRAEAASVQEEVQQNEARMLKLRKARSNAKEGDAERRIAEVRSQLNSAQAALLADQSKLAELELEASDSHQFLQEIDRRLNALEASQNARSYLGALRFQFCPCCLSHLPDEQNETHCHLCRNDISESKGDAQILRMKNELALQKKESSALMEARNAEISKLRQQLPERHILLQRLEREFSSLAEAWSTPQELEIEATSRKLGELNQKLVQLAEYQKLATVLDDLQQRRGELEARKSALMDRINGLQSQNEDVKAAARHAIAKELIYLLKNELPRQEEFISAQSVDWSFGKNRVAVNGNTQFSESSMVILRHSFHLAILLASAKNAFFRYPRFLMLDGIEDGGQEQERSFAFQRLIVNSCEALENDYQVIYATSQIEPSLDTDEYVVGKASSTNDKTLAII